MRRSASSVGTFERCPRAYEYRYLKQVRYQTAWSIKGSAIHDAIRHYYTTKLETGASLAVPEVLEQFRESVQTRLGPMGQETHGAALWFNGESPDQVLTDGLAQLRVYLEQIAPTITPVAVEERLAMTLPSGLEVVGFIDLVDAELRIRDAKFGVDLPRSDGLLGEWQPIIYAALWHATTGDWPRAVIFDCVSRGRGKKPNPSVAQLALPITPALVAVRMADFEAVAAEMTTGRYPRRPSEMHCSKCPYKSPCWGDLIPLEKRPSLDPQPSLEPSLRASLEALNP
jgi:PD-(D/E)XK nuclease superfamily